MSIERDYDAAFVARMAAAEKQVQQSYRPVIAVHKWFARRPGTLFRALALSEIDGRPLHESFFEAHNQDGVILDPFMGGGTTLFEADRLGFSVIGYDTNPMSRWVCERELEELDVEELADAGEALCQAVEKEVGGLHETTCEECGDTASVKSFLWVKTHVCGCGDETLLFPGPLVAGRKMGRHTHDVMVCGNCREVNQFLPDQAPADCPNCHTPYKRTAISSPAKCRCGESFTIPAQKPSGPPKHTLFALEYHCAACKKREDRRGRFFKGADTEDHERYQLAIEQRANIESPFWPDAPIPAGDETNRLHRWGYETFRELHNERQLLGLAILAAKINAQPAHLRKPLATVFSDFVRYQNMVCRYDTAALKILDVFSIHGYPVHRVQCEAALIGLPRVGSGGYRHFLAKYVAAKRYCREPYETTWVDDKKTKVPIVGEQIAAHIVDSADRLDEKRAAFLNAASITDEPLEPQTVDLVLTDPPYFAMVQYSELMDFCYAWLRKLVPDEPFFALDSAKSESEVTGNTTQGRGLAGFAEGLSGVYQAATRALKPGHAFAFTYHHNDLRSYAAVVVACLDSGLIPITTLPCPSEMRGSVHISKSDSSRVDTVFVLRKPPAVMPDEIHEPIHDLVEAQVQHLLDADLKVTTGDRRCLRHGLIAEAAMRQLVDDWDSNSSIEDRFQAATAMLLALDADPEVTAEGEHAESAAAVAGEPAA